jgi:pimeloyl-ACP methyl ester carboxylesterase
METHSIAYQVVGMRTQKSMKRVRPILNRSLMSAKSWTSTRKSFDVNDIQRHKGLGVLNTRPAATLLRALDRHVPKMSSDTIRGVVRDVWIYLTRPGVQDEIDRVVAQAFTEQPAVVVGHSLGSIVAYQVLRTDPRALKVLCL